MKNFTHTENIDLANSLEQEFEMSNIKIESLQAVLGKMNWISDKTAGWFIEFENGTAVMIENHYMRAGMDVAHLGETEGTWEITTNNERDASANIKDLVR